MVKKLPTARVYRDALLDYIEGSGESGLEQAYGLGRIYLREHGGLLRIIDLHDRALDAIITPATAPAEIRRRMSASMEFLVEVLSPFEMACRCYCSFLDEH